LSDALQALAMSDLRTVMPGLTAQNMSERMARLVRVVSLIMIPLYSFISVPYTFRTRCGLILVNQISFSNVGFGA
jgi:hypothetical protein